MCCLALLCGCTVSQPSPTDWRSSTSRSLDDVASEIATVQLVLRHHASDEMWQAYAVTMLADAEKAVGSTTESIGQTPPGLDAEASDVDDLLGRAEDVVADARQALVAGDPITSDLRKRLDSVRDDLRSEATSIEGAS